MSYIDGFVIPVPAGHREAYRRLAAKAVPVFMEHGALRVVECWGSDLPDGRSTDFRSAVKAEAEENVVFAWVLWPSKAVRDTAGPKVMADPRMDHAQAVFDGSRLIHGGFEVLLDSDAGIGTDDPAEAAR